VTPEAAGHLDKARECPTRARIILAAGVAEDAARNAYLAAFRAAQGRSCCVCPVTKDETSIDIELRRFLPQSFNLKAVADYELGPDAIIPTEQAAAAIETATRFVTCIAELLA
jgi:uncharacterized protein (UPF0332 family)